MPLPQAEYEALRAKGLTHTQVMKRMSSANREIVYKADVAAAKAYIAQPATTQDSQPTTYVDISGDTKPDVRPAWDDRPDYGTVDPYSEIGGAYQPAPLPTFEALNPEIGYEGRTGRNVPLPQDIEDVKEGFFNKPYTTWGALGEYVASASDRGGLLGLARSLGDKVYEAQVRNEYGTPELDYAQNPELVRFLQTQELQENPPVIRSETLDEINELTGKLKIPAGTDNVYIQNPSTGEWEFVTTDKPSLFLATQWIAANEKMFQSDFLTGYHLRNAPGRNEGDLQGYDPSAGQDNPLWEIIGRQPAMLDGMFDFLNQTYDLDIEWDENGKLRGNVDWMEVLKGDPYAISTLEELGYLTSTGGPYGAGTYQGGDSGGRGGSGGRGVGYASRSPQIQNRRSGIRLTSWRI